MLQPLSWQCLPEGVTSLSLMNSASPGFAPVTAADVGVVLEVTERTLGLYWRLQSGRWGCTGGYRADVGVVLEVTERMTSLEEDENEEKKEKG